MATNYRNVVVNLAKQEVGTIGGAASGDDKYIKYYNSITGTTFDVSSTPWCAIFVTYIMRHAGVPTTVCPNYAGCTNFRDTFLIPKGYWKTRSSYTPKPGDIIMFNWKGSTSKLDHTGIVESVSGGKVYTIEGNSTAGTKQSAVRRRSYALTSKYIIGYGAINLDGITVPSPVPNTVPSTNTLKDAVKRFQTWMNANYGTKLEIDGSFGPKSRFGAIKTLQTILNREYDANVPVDGLFGTKTTAAVKAVRKGSTGNLVYLAQGSLYGRGYDAGGFDGSFGPAMDRAVRKFQADKSLASDGSVGPATWKKLCSG